MRLVWLAIMFGCLFNFINKGFSQDLVVLDETTGFEQFRFRDSSARVGLRVQLDSVETLTNIFPILDAPACAVVNDQPLFATTYLGYEISGTLVASSVPSLAQNQTVVLVFNIHMFAGSGNICQAPVCSGNNYAFTLSYHHDDSTTPIQAATNNQATFSGPPFGGFDLVERVATTGRGAASCTEIFNTLNSPFPYEGVDVNLLNDPLTCVLIGVDYDAFLDSVGGDFLLALSGFLLPVGNDRFFDLYDAVVNQGLENTTEPVVDIGSGREFDIEPDLGGGGGVLGDGGANCSVEFWNFFDVTDFPAQGADIKSVISDWGSRRVAIDTRQTNMDHRETTLYLGYQNDCSARNGLGNSLAGFEVTGLAFKPEQLVEVTVEVPSSWRASATTLRSDYALSFYYRDETRFGAAPIVTGTSRNLTVTLAVPYTFPGEFQIEARIQRSAPVGEPAIASVLSPAHQLTYFEVGDVTFQNAEADQAGPAPDEYLDPGEQLTKVVSVQNVGTDPLQDVNLELDVVSSGFGMLFDSSTATGPFDGIFLVNEVVDINLFYQLFSAKAPCGPLVMNYLVTYSNNGFTSSYEANFSVEANCELVTTSLILDETWTAQECTGNPVCSDPNCTGSELMCSTTDGWFYESASGNWVGGTLDNSFYYELVSPIFRPGDDAQFSMMHESALLLGTAGGVLEYRDCPNGEDCEGELWQDFILPIEQANSVDLYAANPFPSLDIGLDQIISDRPVFSAQSALQSIDEPVPNNLFTRPFAQFRFVYQIAVDSGFPPPGTWTLEAFNYEYEQLLADNVLQLPSPILIPCEGEVLDFVPGAPGSYMFDFYLTLDDILAGNPPEETNMDGMWAYPIAEANTTYYVVVTNLTTGTVRVWPLSAVATQDVPEFEICTDSWLSDPIDAGCDLNDDASNNILDIVIQRNGDLCVD